MKPLIVDEDVDEDLLDACAWYDDQRAGLGPEFLSSVTIREARERPTSFPFVHSLTRRVHVHRFPYKVLFRDLPEAVVILGILHAARDPERYRRRALKRVPRPPLICRV